MAGPARDRRCARSSRRIEIAVIAREAIYAALFALAHGSAGFVTSSRRLRHWTDVAPAEQPALFMSEKGRHRPKQGAGHAHGVDPACRFLHLRPFERPLRRSGEHPQPALDALEAALAPLPVTGLQDLGLANLVVTPASKAGSRPTKACWATRRSR